MGNIVGLATVLAVVLIPWFVQQWWCEREEGIAWNALSCARELPPGFAAGEGVRHGQQGTAPSTPERFIRTLTWTGTKARRAGTIRAFEWTDANGVAKERAYWSKRAEEIRHSFLARTQATAEKWRTIFGALLAVVGSILLIKPSLPQGTTELPAGVFELVILSLLLGVQAVAYTGWAAAGLPKMLVNVDAETAFQQETTYGARSMARLRLGLVLGALSAVLLIVTAALLYRP